MYPRVTSVIPNDDHTLILTFTNGECKSYDVKPFLNRGVFAVLRDISVFKSVHVSLGSVAWPGDIDLCPDTLYEDSIPYPSIP